MHLAAVAHMPVHLGPDVHLPQAPLRPGQMLQRLTCSTGGMKGLPPWPGHVNRPPGCPAMPGRRLLARDLHLEVGLGRENQA